MSPRWITAGLALALTLCTTVRDARAQDPADYPPSHNVGEALTSGVRQARPYWGGSGPTRGFVAATFDLGVIHFRPTLQLGYGKPHYRWFGAELQSSISPSGGHLYSGLYATHPGIYGRLGTRYEFPVDEYLLPPQEEYVRKELEIASTPQSRYVAAEAEIGGAVSVPGGSALGVLSGWAFTGLPDDYNVFDENLKVVVAPPWVWRARLGYLLHIGWQGSMKLGGAAEVIHVPSRDALIVRAGPLVTASLTHHLEATGGIMLVAASPDRLGVVGADLGQLGLRYRWATGDHWPDFP